MSAPPTDGWTRRAPVFISDDFSLPLDAFAIPPQYAPYLTSVLLPHGLVLDRCDKLAQDIAAAYPLSTPHFLVVLKGGNVSSRRRAHDAASETCTPVHLHLRMRIHLRPRPRLHLRPPVIPSRLLLSRLSRTQEFASDLTRALRTRHALSGRTHLPFTLDFVRVKSYEGTESTGKGASHRPAARRRRPRGPVVVSPLFGFACASSRYPPRVTPLL